MYFYLKRYVVFFSISHHQIVALGPGFQMHVRVFWTNHPIRPKQGKITSETVIFGTSQHQGHVWSKVKIFETVSYGKSDFKGGHFYDIFSSVASKGLKMPIFGPNWPQQGQALGRSLFGQFGPKIGILRPLSEKYHKIDPPQNWILHWNC